MSKRSLIAFEHYREASQKFDYFMTGLSSALCAFIGQTLHPEKISFSPSTLELISLLLLVSSVVAGFKRIESMVQSYKTNHQLLDIRERIGQVTFKSTAQTTMIDKNSGDVMTPAQAKEIISILRTQVPIFENSLEKWASKSCVFYKARNWLLLSGFLSLIVARVWLAYR